MGKRYGSGSADIRRAKEDYITGADSYRVVAERYGLTPKTVEQIGWKEGWTKLRREYREKVTRETVEKVQAVEVHESADRLVMLRSAADRMTEVISGVLDDSEQFYRHMVKDRAGEVSCETYEKVDTKAIRDLTVSIRDLAGVLRDLYEKPKVETRQAMEIAREKLDMDRQRQEEVGTEGLAVEFEGDSNDWAG